MPTFTAVACTRLPYCALMVEATVCALLSAGVTLYSWARTTSVYGEPPPPEAGVAVQVFADRVDSYAPGLLTSIE